MRLVSLLFYTIARMTGQAKSGELGLLGPVPMRSIPLLSVTPALVAGIYAFLAPPAKKVVDNRDEPGHDSE